MKYINPMVAAIGWDVKLIKFCSMHCSNIGILHVLNGSLVVLPCEHSYFGNDALEKQLRTMTTRMRQWASACQIEHSQVYITSGMLKRDPRGYPELLGKAHNSRVLMAFLAVCVRSLAQQHPADLELQLAARVATTMSVWHDLLERTPRYMTQIQAEALDNCGLSFVREYKRLAVLAFHQSKHRWKLIPKLHAFRHLCREMLATHYCCRFYHAFLDEDAMGSAKRIAQRVHPSVLEVRVLSRLLLRYKHAPRPTV